MGWWMKVLMMSLSIFLIFACAQVRKFYADPNSQVSPNDLSKKNMLIVTCNMEAEQASTVLTRPSRDYQYIFEPSCPQKGLVNKQEDLTKPMNMIFVIDRTGSMKASLDAVKRNVLNLSLELKARNWNVMFGAIGFVDNFKDFRIIDFAEVEKFQLEIGDWEVVDGQDFQEAGQHALSLAVSKMVNFKSIVKDRDDAIDVIIYITDNVAYTESSRTDFSVDALAKKILAAKKSFLPQLEFYYSIPDGVREEEKVEGAPELQAQIDELILKADLKASKKISFPLSSDILSAFAKTYLPVITKKTQLCQLEDVSLSAKNSEQSMSLLNSGLLKSAKEKIPVEFDQAIDPAANDYMMTIKRCCHYEASSCRQNDDSQLEFTFHRAPK